MNYHEQILKLIKQVENLKIKDFAGINTIRRQARMILRYAPLHENSELEYVQKLDSFQEPELLGGFASWVDIEEVASEEYYPSWDDQIKSLLEILSDIAVELQIQSASPSPTGRSLFSNRIFVVHGHDNDMKQTVARKLEKLGFEAVILHEMSNRGQTIIEKFESNSDVGFAVVLLSPDDVGNVKTSVDRLNKRARQNVIFELGFFIGKLGRERVLALYQDGVEIPSDMQGVVYTPYDGPEGSWRLELIRELKAVGYEVDANKIL